MAEHLRTGAAEPFLWGFSDCCLFPSDWVLARRGVDPAAPLRGRYGTAYGAYRHIARLGGFEQMVRGLMNDAGIQETDAPEPGDIGVIITDLGPTIGIKTTRGWVMKAPRGIVGAPLKHVAAWSV